MPRASLGAYAAVATLFVLGAIGCYSMLAAFIVDDRNYARACFGALNLLMVHVAILRGEVEAARRERR